MALIHYILLYGSKTCKFGHNLNYFSTLALCIIITNHWDIYVSNNSRDWYKPGNLYDTITAIKLILTENEYFW